jgi:hypothetical protein
MKSVIAVIAAVCELNASAALAQSPDTGELMRRVGAYTQRFVDTFTNVVAEERYDQRFVSNNRRRRLTSDFLLVAVPGSTNQFMTFRDVREVDGTPVADQQERITQLFLQPYANALKRAQEIQRDGLRHNLPPGRLVDPLTLLAFLQLAYQKNFRFTRQGLEPTLGADIRKIDIVRSGPPSRNQMRGSVWASEATGEVVKTQLRVGPAGSETTTTTFALDPRLQIRVPVEMRDETGGFIGSAAYSNFRRFSVRTESVVEEPAPK